MGIYLTSDLHLNHDRAFIYKPRGFSCIDDMNAAIETNWNSVISPDDEVYVLGDLMLGGNEKGVEILQRLNGKIHITLGNHDTDTRVELYRQMPNVVEIAQAIRFKYNGYHFFCCHYPTITSNLEKESLKQCTINLFGHTHQTTNFYNDMPFIYHVGVDSHKCKPVNIDEAIQDMNSEAKKCFSYL